MSVYKCVCMCNSIKQVICEYVCEENGEIRFTFSSTKCKSTTRVITILMELTAQKGKGDREKRTSDRARTRDLCSIAECA